MLAPAALLALVARRPSVTRSPARRPLPRPFRRAGQRRAGGGHRAPSRAATATLADAAATAVAAQRPSTARAATLFRHVTPGDGYRCSVGGAERRAGHGHEPDATRPSRRSTRRSTSTPASATSRRVTARCCRSNVSLPGPVEDGPVPDRRRVLGLRPVEPRRTPAGVRPSRRLLGYATVGVNLRGTGCSGGAFDYFEPLQSLDGYDAIETVAAQPWVAHGKVGMVGISYPGITQLFVAATRPPHLAAITPLSVIDDTYDVAVPRRDPQQRVRGALGRGPPSRRARPSASGGSAQRIAAGDTTCAANQALRLQSPDVHREIAGVGHPTGRRPTTRSRPRRSSTRSTCRCSSPARGRTRRPAATSPTCSTTSRPGIAGEGHAHERRARRLVRPRRDHAWVEFLDFYVARRVPTHLAATRAIASAILAARVRQAASRCRPTASTRSARLRHRACARTRPSHAVRVLFDVGAGGPPGAPFAAFETSRSRRGRHRRPTTCGTSSPTARSTPKSPVDHQRVRQLPVRPAGVPAHRRAAERR